MGSDSSADVAHVAAVFNEAAAGYDSPVLRFFSFVADRLALRLNPAPGDKILDVATGTGVVALALAQAVGPSGRVVGIDIAEAMLERAHEKIRKFGVSNVDLHVMDAGRLEFRREYFHHVVCSFGLFFLPDMAAALKEWARVLRPGGRVLLTAFGPKAFQPMMDLLKDRLRAYGVESPQSDRPFAGKRLADPDVSRSLLEQAGFADVQVETEQLGYHLRNAEDWWEVVWNSGFRSQLRRLGEAELVRLRSEHGEEVGRLATDNGIWLDVETRFVSARKP
jgi:ubiquinone/menaquinone biosynthesis C-methylase UbiE